MKTSITNAMWNLFKNFSWLYKYGMPIFLGLIILAFHFRTSVFLAMYGDVLSQLVVLGFCFREYFEAFRRHKCRWQIASISGVVTYSIFNIIYYMTGENEAVFEYQYSGFKVWCSVVFICFIIETSSARRLLDCFYSLLISTYIYVHLVINNTYKNARRKWLNLKSFKK